MQGEMWIKKRKKSSLVKHEMPAASHCIFSVFNHNKLPGVEHDAKRKMQEAPVKIGWLTVNTPKGSVIC